ncbi:rod shape-determining protein MreD [Paenibacillus sp. y28]|uniref:rod shape-determining protein MreD n=1 Tax=Paenibacillus sp. y28 TaxID=3129110 RepID=UPI00301971E5
MKRHLLWILLLGLLLVEGTVLKWLIPVSWQSHIYVEPHFVLAVVMFIGMYLNRHAGLVYGLIFGFMMDLLYYGHALGVLSFCMGLCGYAAGLMSRGPQQLFGVIFVMTLGNVVFDTLQYGVYRFFLRVTTIPFEWTFVYKIVPSMLLNLTFALLIYIPMRKWLEGMQPYIAEEDK